MLSQTYVTYNLYLRIPHPVSNKTAALIIIMYQCVVVWGPVYYISQTWSLYHKTQKLEHPSFVCVNLVFSFQTELHSLYPQTKLCLCLCLPLKGCIADNSSYRVLFIHRHTTSTPEEVINKTYQWNTGLLIPLYYRLDMI